MLSLASAIARAKNNLADEGAWLALLKIELNDVDNTILRFVRNTEDIEFDGETWTAFPFGLGEAAQNTDGSVQTVSIQISNILRIVEQYIRNQDGAPDAEITLYVVYSEALTAGAVIEELFSIGDIDCTPEWVSIELMPENLWALRCPRHVYNRTGCGWGFGSTECGYTGSTYTTCSGTLAGCIARGRVNNYRAFPAIPGEGFDEDGTAASVADTES